MMRNETGFGNLRGGAGFTFLEVLIVMAVIAILAAVAYPSYLSYIAKSRRAATEGFMLEVAGRQERFLLDNRGYATSIGTGSGGLGVVIPPTVSGSYTVTTTSPRSGITTPSYSVDAVPSAAQAAKDIDCGTLSVNEQGVKGRTGSASLAACWQQ